MKYLKLSDPVSKPNIFLESLDKRRKITTERFSNLKDICREYDNLSGPERQERLIEFLGLFARRDAIRDNQFEFATDSDSEPSSSDNENE